MIFNNLKNDLRASLVVFLVALPLCLGIALASGAPLFSGIIAGIIGGIVIGLISDSQISVSGPAAGLTVIVATAINDFGGDYQIFTLCVLIAGLLQLAFGFFKAGRIGDFFPSSVIKGMLAAIGLILILKQIPHAFGYDADYMGDEKFLQPDGQNTFTEILNAMQSLHLGAIIISTSCVFLIFAWEKMAKRNIGIFKIFPGALAAVILGSLLNILFQKFSPSLLLTDIHMVQLNFDGGFANFFQKLSFPKWEALSNPLVYKVAITLAIVGSLESLLSIDAADKLDPHKRNTPKNQELIAQGTGNFLSGLIGGLPITAVIVRTTANITGGAQSKLSTILHGGWLLLCVALIPFILQLIPLAALAAILLIVGAKLTPIKLYKDIYSKGKDQFVPFIVTVVAILFTDLLIGIIIGMAVGVFFVIKSNIHQSVVVVKDHKEYLVRFTKDASFFNKPRVDAILKSIPPKSHVTIDGSNSVYIDHDIILMLEDFLVSAREKNIDVNLTKSSLALSDFFKE